jgi:hypothetical protein
MAGGDGYATNGRKPSGGGSGGKCACAGGGRRREQTEEETDMRVLAGDYTSLFQPVCERGKRGQDEDPSMLGIPTCPDPLHPVVAWC